MRISEKRVKYIPQFLMIIGASNLCLTLLVAGMRRLSETDTMLFGIAAYDLLSLIEPYGKMLWETGVVCFFFILIVRGKWRLDKSLILLWSFIIIEIQCIYYISSNYYGTMIDSMLNFSGTAAYVSFYAGTHVFKYVLMYMSIVFAIFTTGLFLEDRLLPVIAVVMGIIYAMCFGIQSMPTITLPDGSSVGVVIPAAIFHIAQTLIIFLTGLYLRLRYHLKEKEVLTAVKPEAIPVKRKTRKKQKKQRKHKRR